MYNTPILGFAVKLVEFLASHLPCSAHLHALGERKVGVAVQNVDLSPSRQVQGSL